MEDFEKNDIPEEDNQIVPEQAEDEGYQLVREIDEEYVKKIGIFRRFAYIFFSPFKLVANIDVYPNLITPFILLIFVCILTGIGSQSIIGLTTEHSMKALEGAGGSRLSAMMEAARSIQPGADMASFITGAAGTAVGALAGIMIGGLFSALVWFIASKIFKGEASYKKLYSLFLHVSILNGIFGAVVYAFNYVTSSLLNPLSIQLLMPSVSSLTPLGIVLSSISLPAVLGWIMTAKGLSVFNKFSFKKAAVITVCLAVLSILFLVVFSYASTALLGSILNNIM